MRDRRPARNSERWDWQNAVAWWIADRFQGRKVFGRVSHGERGWFIDGGTVDLEAMRARAAASDARMEITIYDPPESEGAAPK